MNEELKDFETNVFGVKCSECVLKATCKPYEKDNCQVGNQEFIDRGD